MSVKPGLAHVKHQRSVGASYFDAVAQIAAGGAASTLALAGSTEEKQVVTAKPEPIQAAGSQRR